MHDKNAGVFYAAQCVDGWFTQQTSVIICLLYGNLCIRIHVHVNVCNVCVSPLSECLCVCFVCGCKLSLIQIRWTKTGSDQDVRTGRWQEAKPDRKLSRVSVFWHRFSRELAGQRHTWKVTAAMLASGYPSFGDQMQGEVSCNAATAWLMVYYTYTRQFKTQQLNVTKSHTAVPSQPPAFAQKYNSLVWFQVLMCCRNRGCKSCMHGCLLT